LANVGRTATRATSPINPADASTLARATRAARKLKSTTANAITATPPR
jgi:hypothetical protein